MGYDTLDAYHCFLKRSNVCSDGDFSFSIILCAMWFFCFILMIPAAIKNIFSEAYTYVFSSTSITVPNANILKFRKPIEINYAEILEMKLICINGKGKNLFIKYSQNEYSLFFLPWEGDFLKQLIHELEIRTAKTCKSISESS